MNQPAIEPKRRSAVATKSTNVSTKVAVAALLPVFAWAAILFALSSIPGKHIPAVHISLIDKVVHCFVYAVLGAVSFRALVLTTRLRGMGAVLVAVLIALAYGASDEIHQMFVPQRSPELLDVLADVVGGALGALTAHRFHVYIWRQRAP